MKRLAGLCLLLLAGTAHAQPTDLKSRLSVMPDDVRSWAWRQAGCNHWREEMPGDSERARRIKEAMNDLRCYDLSRDSEMLRRRYVNRANILDLLANANELKAD
ncbi:hypothetical protein [Roseiterribacter gracilis]|uniref:Uncharacterized protein n=1 Tax=Roseiterribacter gracilis TaxID=2812848 RepID=A0A8S8XEH9_9PROT|nr:hypothetical protein TMPK1_17470 [Rhodospirillales bacterium TMPK1]